MNELISSYRNALTALPASSSERQADSVLEILSLRDRIATAIKENPVIKFQSGVEILELDNRLMASAPLIDQYLGPNTLGRWRQAFPPDANAWWWTLDERTAEAERKRAALWLLLTGFAVVLSLSFATEISSRFLTGTPDKLGIFTTATQAFLALLAGSAALETGRRWITDIFSIFHIRRQWQPLVSFVLALLVLGSIILFRTSLPRIARHYNEQGWELLTQKRVADAQHSLQRAVALNPDYAAGHYNLALAYEAVLDYGKAIASYRRVIEIEPTFEPAYNNLARVYLLQGSDYPALDLLNELFGLTIHNPETQYAAYKNRGWAHLRLEFYQLAEDDLRAALKIQNRAEAHCILGQVLDKRHGINHTKKDPAPENDGQLQWNECIQLAKQGQKVEPRWLAQAMTRIREEGRVK